MGLLTNLISQHNDNKRREDTERIERYKWIIASPDAKPEWKEHYLGKMMDMGGMKGKQSAGLKQLFGRVLGFGKAPSTDISTTPNKGSDNLNNISDFSAGSLAPAVDSSGSPIGPESGSFTDDMAGAASNQPAQPTATTATTTAPTATTSTPSIMAGSGTGTPKPRVDSTRTPGTPLVPGSMVGISNEQIAPQTDYPLLSPTSPLRANAPDSPSPTSSPNPVPPSPASVGQRGGTSVVSQGSQSPAPVDATPRVGGPKPMSQSGQPGTSQVAPMTKPGAPPSTGVFYTPQEKIAMQQQAMRGTKDIELEYTTQIENAKAQAKSKADLSLITQRADLFTKYIGQGRTPHEAAAMAGIELKNPPAEVKPRNNITTDGVGPGPDGQPMIGKWVVSQDNPNDRTFIPTGVWSRTAVPQKGIAGTPQGELLAPPPRPLAPRGGAGTGGVAGPGAHMGATDFSHPTLKLQAMNFLITGKYPTGISSRTALGAQKIQAIDSAVAEVMKERGLSEADVLTLRMQFNASKGNTANLEKLYGATEAFAGLVESQFGRLEEAAKQLAFENSPIYSLPLAYMREHVTGNPEYGPYVLLMTQLQTEVARVLNNPASIASPSEGALAEMRKVFKPTMSYEQALPIIDLLRQELNSKKSALQNEIGVSIQRGLGKLGNPAPGANNNPNTLPPAGPTQQPPPGVKFPKPTKPSQRISAQQAQIYFQAAGGNPRLAESWAQKDGWTF